MLNSYVYLLLNSSQYCFCLNAESLCFTFFNLKPEWLHDISCPSRSDIDRITQTNFFEFQLSMPRLSEIGISRQFDGLSQFFSIIGPYRAYPISIFHDYSLVKSPAEPSFSVYLFNLYIGFSPIRNGCWWLSPSQSHCCWLSDSFPINPCMFESPLLTVKSMLFPYNSYILMSKTRMVHVFLLIKPRRTMVWRPGILFHWVRVPGKHPFPWESNQGNYAVNLGWALYLD